MKKHLFYTITRSEKAGAQFHVELLMRHFREHYDISIALGEPSYLSETALSLGIKVHLVPALQRAIRPHLDIIADRELKSLFQRQAPDLVHSHSFKAGMLSRLAAS